MASVNVNLSCDLQHPVRVQYLDGNMFSMDNGGNTINVLVYDNGEPAQIGGTVTANVIRADGGTVAVTGSLSGNKVTIVMPQACYAVTGAVSVIIKLTQDTTVTTIAAFVANVYRSSTDTVVDPGTIIQSVEDLIADIEGAVADIPVAYNASFAPAYSNSSTYAVGQYVTYDGYLWRCTTAITTAESWTSGHWTKVALAEELSDVKSAIHDIAPKTESTNLLNYDTVQKGKQLNSTNGTVASATGYVVSDYIPINNGDSVYMMVKYIAESPNRVVVITPSLSNNWTLCVYDSSKTYINGWTASQLDNPKTISASNAKYIRIGFAQAHFENEERQYGIFLNSQPTVDNYEVYFDPYYTIGEDVIIPQIGTIPEPLYELSNFSFGNDTFDSMGVTGISGHRYTVVYSRLVGAYAQVGIISGGAWKGSEYGSNNLATFTATASGTFYFKKISGSAQTIEKVYIFDTTGNDDLMAFIYTYKLDSVNLPNNMVVQKELRSWYYGKKFAALGDSVTEQGKWINPVREKCPFFSVVNCGIGGTHVGGYGTNCFWKDTRVNTIPTDADFITIMGGTNDCSSSRTIGEVSRSNYDTDTFVGAYNVLISKIFYKFTASGDGYYDNVDYSGVTRVSTTKPIYILIITCGFCGNTSYAGSNYARMENFANACIEIGKLWGIPVADIYHNAGINPITYPMYLSDTVHPNDDGGRKIASAIIGTMMINEPVE